MDIQRTVISHDTGALRTNENIRQKDVVFGNGRLVLVAPGEPCKISVCHGSARDTQTYECDVGACAWIIACQERATARLPTNRPYKLIEEGDLCCILAFVDVALNTAHVQAVAPTRVCCEPVPDHASNTIEQLGQWLTLAVMQGGSDNALLHHLRRQESYALAHYLMRSPAEGAHLNELCVAYGLSYSHFRRLCRRSLGTAIKSRLRTWRAARTVLDIVESDESILQIAVGNGYTSASHVSTDIKQLFGFTPRTARNARDLLP